jgi:hypothetical protein
MLKDYWNWVCYHQSEFPDCKVGDSILVSTNPILGVHNKLPAWNHIPIAQFASKHLGFKVAIAGIDIEHEPLCY